jgi:hypothetical protein
MTTRPCSGRGRVCCGRRHRLPRVSFTPPRTRVEASRAIEELKRRRPDSRADQRRDRRVVQDRIAAAGDDARIRDREIDGYGSSATWAARP